MPWSAQYYTGNLQGIVRKVENTKIMTILPIYKAFIIWERIYVPRVLCSPTAVPLSKSHKSLTKQDRKVQFNSSSIGQHRLDVEKVDFVEDCNKEIIWKVVREVDVQCSWPSYPRPYDN